VLAQVKYLLYVVLKGDKIMITRISTEIKRFMEGKFCSDTDIDDLCRELNINNVYRGISNYKDQLTQIVVYIESNWPDHVARLYCAVRVLKTEFNSEIDTLFAVLGLTGSNDSVAIMFTDIKGFSKIEDDSLKAEIEKINHDFIPFQYNI